jgi:Tfp pilus assembly protein PilV
MTDRLRRRLRADEAGISLVEMLIAIFVLTVALFGLLGSLVTVAKSTYDQRMRTNATRVATGEVEALRALGFDQLEDGSETYTVTTPEGREFTVTTEIATVDALDPDTGENEDVKQITAVVTWDVRDSTRTSTYTTMVAPEATRAIGGRISVDLDPNPATVIMEGDRAGFMTGTVRVLAIFDFPFEGFPRVAFTDGSGPTLKQHDLNPPEDELESSVWHLELVNTCASPTSSSCVYYQPSVMADPEEPHQIHFTVTAGGVSTLATLRLQPEIDGAPDFVSPTTITDPI